MVKNIMTWHDMLRLVLWSVGWTSGGNCPSSSQMFLSWSDFLVCHDKGNILYACYRFTAGEEIGELLADFRNKRALGLGSLFGDHQLQGIVISHLKKNWNLQTMKKLISVGFVVNKIMKTLTMLCFVSYS